MIQVDGDGSVLADVRFKRLFATDGLAFPLRDNRSVINPSREVIEHLPHLTELLRQPSERHIPQIQPCKDAHAVHLLSRFLTNTPDFLHLQLGDEVQGPVWMNYRQTIRLAPVGGNLRQELAVTYTSRCRQSCRLTDALLNLTGYVYAQFYSFLILCYIEECFIERDWLNQVSIIMENLVQLSRHLLIPLEVRFHDNQLRTQAFGYLNGLGRMHSEPSGLVAGRRYHATFSVMANRYRLSFQFRIVSLLHSGKELVHVHVDDFHLLLYVYISLLLSEPM